MNCCRHLIFIALLCPGLAVFAAPQVIESGAHRVAMLELFTSQGCSSCPPADAWLSRLRRHEGLWQDFVPVAWHVDYWNYLGWRDRYSSPAYSSRHRGYKHNGGVALVYTPGFLVNGKEWRGWRYTQAPPLSNSERPGPIRIEVNGNRIKIQFHPAVIEPGTGMTAHAALLGMQLTTEVDSGENHGKTLQEDFVVLAHSSGNDQDSSELMQWQLTLPESIPDKPVRLALVAWVNRTGNPKPVQATGGWLSQ